MSYFLLFVASIFISGSYGTMTDQTHGCMCFGICLAAMGVLGGIENILKWLIKK